MSGLPVNSQLARKGPLSHPAVLMLMGSAVLLAAYALGYLPQTVGPLIVAFDEAHHHIDMAAFDPVVYGIAGLVAFLFLLAVLRSIDMLLRKISGRDTLATPPASTVEEQVSVVIAAPSFPEAAPLAQTDRLGVRSRVSDQSSAQRLAAHLTGLQNANPRDSRFRTRAHFAETNRRASDYSGPRRRATDNQADPEYAGPFRRSTDRQLSSGQRKAERPSGTRPVMDAAELNRLDPLFIAPRNRKLPTDDRD